VLLPSLHPAFYAFARKAKVAPGIAGKKFGVKRRFQFSAKEF